MFRVLTIFLGKFRGKVLKLNLSKKIVGGRFPEKNHHNLRCTKRRGQVVKNCQRERGSLQNRLFLLEKGHKNSLSHSTSTSGKVTYTGWCLNQPIWKSMFVKLGSSSPKFGVNIKKYLKPPPRIRILKGPQPCHSTSAPFHFSETKDRPGYPPALALERSEVTSRE